MMAPAVFRRHRKRGGEGPLFSSSSLTFYLDWRRVSPLVHGLHGGGGVQGGRRQNLHAHPSVRTSRVCWNPKSDRPLSPSPPVAPECRRGHHRVMVIYTNTSVIFTNIFITFPHLSIAVHSPATRCTLYLNMVLYASYYYPMMC